MSNIHRTVFYIGVTSNIRTRVWQHKNGEGGKFTSTYKCHYLLYYEEYNDINKAMERETQEWLILLQTGSTDMKQSISSVIFLSA